MTPREYLLECESDLSRRLIGRKFGNVDPCWQTVRWIYEEALGIRVERDPAKNANLVEEVWYVEESDSPPIETAEPWDIWACAIKSAAADHIGLIVDSATIVHGTAEGVCQTQTRRWWPYLVAVYRLRKRPA